MDNKDKLPILVKTKGYVHYEGKLQSCKYHHTDFVLCDTYPERNYTHHHVVELQNGELISPEDNEIFDTIEDFENVMPASTRYSNIRQAVQSVMASVNIGIKNEEQLVFYTFENGEPIRYKRELKRFAYDYNKWVFVANCDVFPKGHKVYATREKALSFNSYTIVNDDGSEEVRDGVGKLLMLDPDQRELLDKFEALAKELKVQGVLLVGDNLESYSAFNTRHVERVSFMDDYYKEDGNWEKGERYNEAYNLNLNLGLRGNEWEIYIKRNEEDKK